MADERNRWLNQAAAERVLRGGPAAPVGDVRAREAEARLRAALDMLAAPAAPAGAELPGEAAAVAAFRAARAGSAASSPEAAAAAAPSPIATAPSASVLDLGTFVPASPFAPAAAARRRPRQVRFALAAALASVAVGGIAAAAGAGLLDRVTHDTATPGPAVSLSSDEDPAPAGGTAGPSSGPQLRPHPLRSPDGSLSTPGGTAAGGGFADGSAQGGGTGAESGFDAGTGRSAGSAATGGAGGNAGKETLGGATELHDKDKEIRLKAVDLCEAYRSGHMTNDRRERLSKLAQGLARIPSYCEALLDGPSGTKGSTTAPRSSGNSGDVLKAPTLAPAVPTPSSSPVTRPTTSAFNGL
ncbi:hypothetical protein AB0F11_10810 [Streptomyces sp. NPDC032472]|uniref:hypothetical protein n=1 Tax=Streptomyces sp. NPDC032472 TaxID=3155018 RepID=UPI0033CB6045